MNIYLVSRTDKFSWDDYDSFVCVAPDEKTALDIIPDTDTENPLFYENIDTSGFTFSFGSWTGPNHRKCELIGIANEAKIRIVCASFNAG